MQIPIDYMTEIAYSERKKIRWIIEEFQIQFKKTELRNGTYSDRQKKLANEIIKYLLESVDISNEEILEFLCNQLNQLQSMYKDLFQ